MILLLRRRVDNVDETIRDWLGLIAVADDQQRLLSSNTFFLFVVCNDTQNVLLINLFLIVVVIIGIMLKLRPL